MHIAFVVRRARCGKRDHWRFSLDAWITSNHGEMNMQVIGCQFDIAWENKPANYDRVRELLKNTSIEPGALIVLPEMFATGFSMNVDHTAESANGPTQQFLSQLARDTGAYVMGGIVSINADGRGRNEALVVDS